MKSTSILGGLVCLALLTPTSELLANLEHSRCTARYSKKVIKPLPVIGIAWGIGTLIGQGGNQIGAYIADPIPVYWTGVGGSPFPGELTDVQVDELLPSLFSAAGRPPMTAADILAANDLTPGLGTATLNYLRSNIKANIDMLQGSAAYWSGYPEQVYPAYVAANAQIMNLIQFGSQAAPLIASTQIPDGLGGLTWLEATASRDGEYSYLTLAELESWVQDVQVNGAAALDPGEVPLMQKFYEIAHVTNSGSISDQMVQFVTDDGGLSPGERNLMVSYGGGQSLSEMITSCEECWMRIGGGLMQSPLISVPEPATLVFVLVFTSILTAQRRQTRG